MTTYETLDLILTGVGLGGAVVAVLYTASQVKLARTALLDQQTASRRARTFQYMDKLQSAELIEKRVLVLEALEKWGAGTTLDERKAVWEEWGVSRRVERAQVHFVLNIFEEIAVELRVGLLDEEVLRVTLKQWSAEYWGRAEPWILARRTQPDRTDLYAEWEEMNKKLQTG